jgi:hypothetical protein
MLGNYPPGVFEHTRGAPWNEYEIITCNGCAREFYPNERPRGPLPDDFTGAPETEHGNEHGLCATCETERDICTECNATFLTADGLKPHTVDGCAECRADPPCIHCGAPVSVCECYEFSHRVFSLTEKPAADVSENTRGRFTRRRYLGY